MWVDYGHIPPTMREMYWPVVKQGVQLAEELAERDGVEELDGRISARTGLERRQPTN